MKDYHINVFWSEEDGCYVADIPDLEACSAFGATPAPSATATPAPTATLTPTPTPTVIYAYGVMLPVTFKNHASGW